LTFLKKYYRIPITEKVKQISVGQQDCINDILILYKRITEMKLLTKEIKRKLPPLYSQEEKGLEAIIQVKFFDPCGSWTWYATEFDGEDTFFGLVDGLEKELGYFSFNELKEYKGKLGIGIERDLYFDPQPLKNFVNDI